MSTSNETPLTANHLLIEQPTLVNTKVFLLAHVDDAANAVACLHVAEGLVDACQRLAVSDELVDLELAIEVVLDEVGKLSAALDTAESATLPYTAGDELECCLQIVNICISLDGSDELTPCRDLLAGSSDTNDDALTPTLVAGLESTPHDVDVTSAVEGVIAATIRHLNQLLLDALALGQLQRVDEVGSTELLRPLLLAVVNIDDDDLACTLLDGTLDDR